MKNDFLAIMALLWATIWLDNTPIWEVPEVQLPVQWACLQLKISQQR